MITLFQRFKNLKIGWKYFLALILTFALFIVAAVVISSQFYQIAEDIEQIDRDGGRALQISELASLFRARDVSIADYINTQDSNYIQEYERYENRMEELIQTIESRMNSDLQLSILNEIKKNNIEIDEFFINRTIPAVQSNDQLALRSSRNVIRELRAVTVDLLEELNALVAEERNHAISQAREAIARSLLILAIAIISAVIIGSAVVYFVNRGIQRNLNVVVNMANEIADGNLRVEEMKYDGKDEIGQLSTSINQMKRNLQQMMQEILKVSGFVTSQSEMLKEYAEEVKEGGQQISTTMHELSGGSEEQANQSNQVSEHLTNFVSTVTEVTENGEKVNKQANQMLDLTVDGSNAMENSVSKMTIIDQSIQSSLHKVKGLDQKANEITGLIHVIQAIADQTNLLALNAAIEAARAGEHGKGFAVVADEVRKLAEQVSISLLDITEITTTIQQESSEVVQSLESGYEEVTEGTATITNTGNLFVSLKNTINELTNDISKMSDSFHEILTQTKTVNRSMESVAAISEESAAGIEEITATIQQSSASMDEIAKSANELEEQSNQLNKLIQQFKL